MMMMMMIVFSEQGYADCRMSNYGEFYPEDEKRYAGLQSSIPLHTERTHTRTPNVMMPHHHIDFLHFQQILKSVTLIKNIELPEDDLNDDRNMLERF